MNIKAKKNPETGDIVCFFYEEDITEHKNIEIGLKAVASRNYDFVGIADIKTGQYRSFARTGAFAVPEEAYDDYNQATKDFADELRTNFPNYEDYIKVREWVSFENVTEQLEKKDYYTFTFKLQNETLDKILTYQMVYFYLDNTKEKVVVARSNISIAVQEEQRRQEALESALLKAELANASKSAFMSRINRDLRTPLDAIMGFAELSEDIDDVGELKKNLCKIKDSSSFLLEVINDMLLEGATADNMTTAEQLESRKKSLSEYNEILGVSLKGKQILLCEDHPLNAEVARKNLEKEGCHVIHAWNGIDALKIFSDSREHYFDAILMDVQMPLLDGISTTKKIRKMKRTDNSVPIVAMTASAYDTDIEACLGAGMDDHLAKPIDKDLLFQVLRRLMKKI